VAVQHLAHQRGASDARTEAGDQTETRRQDHDAEPAHLDEGEDHVWPKRVGFKLGKLAVHVARVTVRFESVSGPKGAPTQACRVKIVTVVDGSVVVEARAADLRAASDAAGDAAERVVRRLVDKRRH
jgi:hypothetical protein